MLTSEIQHYAKLNEFATQGGIVIFGCKEDNAIPTCELRQAFTIESNIYNRSFDSLSIKDAANIYNEAVASLSPETVLLHLGEADLKDFEETTTDFDNSYRELISSVKYQNKKCRICIVSLKNYDNDPRIEELNKHLKYIADSEQCEYADISSPKLWNPQATMHAASFVYSIGFVHPLKNKRPLYDLVKILFCFNA